jgi:hypothetical protein
MKGPDVEDLISHVRALNQLGKSLCRILSCSLNLLHL